jgi:hypothetical protein
MWFFLYDNSMSSRKRRNRVYGKELLDERKSGSKTSRENVILEYIENTITKVICICSDGATCMPQGLSEWRSLGLFGNSFGVAFKRLKSVWKFTC